MAKTKVYFKGAGMRYISIGLALLVGFLAGQILSASGVKAEGLGMEAVHEQAFVEGDVQAAEILLLREKIEHLSQVMEVRISDLHRTLALLGGILGLVVTLSWMNLVGVARSKAAEEIESSFKENEEEVKKITQEIRRHRVLVERKVTEMQISVKHSRDLLRILYTEARRAIGSKLMKEG